jgi:LacI family transcriptional regulator
MSTIHDVAAKAGVSIKTVSRVLNNYKHISQRTRSKVQAAIDELDYSPSSIARQMRLGDSLSIGMLYGDPSSGYQASLNHAFLSACSNARRYLVVELFDETSSDWASQVDSFLTRTKIKNMVLVPPLCDSTELHDLLRANGVNFVLISPSRTVSSTVSVLIDEKQAATEVTNLLINLGHKRIAHISGDMGHVATLLRYQGFEDAILRAKLNYNPQDLTREGQFSFKLALRCTEELLSLAEDQRPTAIFCANDEMAAAALMIANRMGYRVPEDLSIVGFDDSYISKVIWPQLTTVSQPFEDIAAEAVNQLGKYPEIGQFDPIIRILPHKLHVRQSTADAPISGGVPSAMAGQ